MQAIFSQSFQLKQCQIASTSNYIFISTNKLIQVYTYRNRQIYSLSIIRLPSIPSIIFASDNKIFSICNSQLMVSEIDKNSQIQEMQYTGIFCNDCISIAIMKNTIALASIQQIEVYDINTALKKVTITSQEDIIKVIACEDQFAFITKQSVGMIFESTSSKYLVQPHLQQNIKDKAKDIDFSYVDLIFDKCLYVINNDGKTILLDTKLTTLRWQNIDETKYKAQSVFNFDGQSIILFNNGVLKINRQENLQFLGKVSFQKIKNCQLIQNVTILHGIGIFGDILLVLDNGGIISISVEITQGQNQKERVGIVQKICELGGGLDLQAQCKLYHQYMTKSSNKHMIIRDLETQKEISLDLLPNFIKHIFLNDEVILGIHKSYDVTEYLVPNIQSSILALSFINRIKAGPVKFYGLQQITETDFIEVYEYDDYLSVMFADSNGSISNFKLNMTKDQHEIFHYQIQSQIQIIKQLDLNSVMIITQDKKVQIYNFVDQTLTQFTDLSKFTSIFSLTIDNIRNLILIGVVQEYQDSFISIYHPKLFIYQKYSNILFNTIPLTETTSISSLPISQDIQLLDFNNKQDQLTFAILYSNQITFRLLSSGLVLDQLSFDDIQLSNQFFYSFFNNKLNVMSNEFYLQFAGISEQNIYQQVQNSYANFARQGSGELHFMNNFEDTQFNSTQVNNSSNSTVRSNINSQIVTSKLEGVVEDDVEKDNEISDVSDEDGKLREGITVGRVSILKDSIQHISDDFDEETERLVLNTIKQISLDDLGGSGGQELKETQVVEIKEKLILVSNLDDYRPIFTLKIDCEPEMVMNQNAMVKKEELVQSQKDPITPLTKLEALPRNTSVSSSDDFDQTAKEITASQLVQLNSSQNIVSTQPIELNNSTLQTTITLTQTLCQMQKLLSKQVLLAETQEIQLNTVPVNQRKEIKKQIDLLQNTIKRINLIYDFDDDVEKKLDELTKTLLGMTIKADQ